MRSLYFKIFLWFWLVVVLVGVTLEISNIIAYRYKQQEEHQFFTVLPDEAKKAAEVFDRSGKPALTEHLHELQQRESATAYFFDEQGKPLLSRDTPNYVREVAAKARRENRGMGKTFPVPSGRGEVAAKQVVGPSGRKYIVVLYEEQCNSRFMTMLSAEAKKAAEVFDRSGKTDLVTYLLSLDYKEHVPAYLFDEKVNPVPDREVPEYIRNAAGKARERSKGGDAPAVMGEAGAVAKQVIGPSGRPYILVMSEEKCHARLMNFLSGKAKEVAEIFDRSGKSALAEDIESWQQREAILVYFFDEQANLLLPREAPNNLREVASWVKEATRGADEEAPVVRGEEGVAAKQVIGPSGRRYTLALQFQRGPISPLWTIFERYPFLRILVIFFIGGLLCLWLTRHITQPLVQLRNAAGSIAEGRFETRVNQTLGRRRDEIGLLGRDFDRMAEQIESLITGQRRLLGDVSHELRSPLSRLIVALSLLRKCSQEETPEYLDRIGLEAARLDKLIGQLLTLARIESGVDAGLRGTFDLTNLVHEVAADGDFEGQAQNRVVKILSADPCTMSGLVELLRSAIENVVRNAIRHTRPGTAVEITLQKQGGPKDSKASLRVRDHGPGVPAEMLPEIFLPFRRATGASDPELDGAGLGLAITERVVRMHAGTVRAANAVDGGLVVEIELPLVLTV